MLFRSGRRVPEDLSVVGYNDTPLAAQLPVPLTTVRVPFERIAADALDLLSSTPPAPQGAAVERRSTPTLIPRHSTARP